MKYIFDSGPVTWEAECRCGVKVEGSHFLVIPWIKCPECQESIIAIPTNLKRKDKE